MMTDENHISRYVHITADGILLNGEMVYQPDHKSGVDMLVDAYKHCGYTSAKFYKMDSLCKLAILASELLLRDLDLAAAYQPDEIAVIVSTAHSSLDTDRRYWESVKAAAPSPSLFVYTLPNVMLGEICIRWGIKGENTCLVSETFDSTFQTDYVNSLIETDNAKTCISGWADYLDGKMDAFFMLVEKNHSSLGQHNPLTVKKLYDRTWKN